MLIFLKNILFVIVVFFVLPIHSILAQQEETDQIIRKMQDQLNLTPQQVETLKPIIAQRISRHRFEGSHKAPQGSILVPVNDNSQNLIASVVEDKKGGLDKEEQIKIGRVLSQEQMSKWDSIQSQLIKENDKRIEEAIKNGEYPAK